MRDSVEPSLYDVILICKELQLICDELTLGASLYDVICKELQLICEVQFDIICDAQLKQ